MPSSIMFIVLSWQTQTAACRCGRYKSALRCMEQLARARELGLDALMVKPDLYTRDLSGGDLFRRDLYLTLVLVGGPCCSPPEHSLASQFGLTSLAFPRPDQFGLPHPMHNHHHQNHHHNHHHTHAPNTTLTCLPPSSFCSCACTPTRK